MKFIDAEKAHHPVAMLCRHLGVSRSGFYAWRSREPSQRSVEDERLVQELREIERRNKGRYGSPRMHAALLAKGEKVGRGRVARLMRDNGIRAKRKRPFRVMTTDSRHGLKVAPNLLARNFTAASPNEVWVGDITCIETGEGSLYVAILLDLFSRRIVGHACGATQDGTLAQRALRRAIQRRAPSPGLMHHTDRGVQYACAKYQALLNEHQFVGSMSRTANCLDNAVAESFFSTLKAELIVDASLPTRNAAARAVRDYINTYYNDDRLHSTLGYISPTRFEELALAA
jgi:transposase InsO family protein